MKHFIFIFLVIAPMTAFAQFGVNFHQSNIPMVGLNVEIKDRVRPELRLGLDDYIEGLSVEFVVTYDLLNKEDYESYMGAGVRGSSYEGAVFPVGFNFYPLQKKNFGFSYRARTYFGR